MTLDDFDRMLERLERLDAAGKTSLSRRYESKSHKPSNTSHEAQRDLNLHRYNDEWTKP